MSQRVMSFKTLGWVFIRFNLILPMGAVTKKNTIITCRGCNYQVTNSSTWEIINTATKRLNLYFELSSSCTSENLWSGIKGVPWFMPKFRDATGSTKGLGSCGYLYYLLHELVVLVHTDQHWDTERLSQPGPPPSPAPMSCSPLRISTMLGKLLQDCLLSQQPRFPHKASIS